MSKTGWINSEEKVLTLLVLILAGLQGLILYRFESLRKDYTISVTFQCKQKDTHTVTLSKKLGESTQELMNKLLDQQLQQMRLCDDGDTR